MIKAKIDESNIFALLVRGSLFLTAFLSVLALLFGTMGFAAGVFTGGILSVVNFFWLRNVLQRSLQLEPKQAPRFAVLRYLVRLAVLAGVIYFLVTTTGINVFGLLLGLSVLVLNIIAFSAYLSLKGG